jgi:hypothetical protein
LSNQNIQQIYIANNKQGCNNIEQIQDSCWMSVGGEFSLSEQTALPTPFITTTTLSYELMQPEKVSLSIYNHLGQQVYQTQENQPQGKQQLIWNAEGFAEGIYYYRLQAGDQVATGKLVKAK